MLSISVLITCIFFLAVAHVTAMFQKVLYPAETSLQQASSPANENKLPSAISYNILITLAMSNPNADWNVESIVDCKFLSYLKIKLF